MIKKEDRLEGVKDRFFKVPNAIFDQGLTASEMVVYFYLVRCSNEGSVAFPSYKKIGEKAGVGKRQAMRIVDSLIRKDMLHKEERIDANETSYTNIYRPNVFI